MHWISRQTLQLFTMCMEDRSRMLLASTVQNSDQCFAHSGVNEAGHRMGNVMWDVDQTVIRELPTKFCPQPFLDELARVANYCLRILDVQLVKYHVHVIFTEIVADSVYVGGRDVRRSQT